MDLSFYLGRRVQIILQGRRELITYLGLVQNCDSDSLLLLDKKGHLVQIKASAIQLIKELP